MDEEVVLKIIEESDRRNVEHDNFNPLTGEGSPLKREKILIEDFGGNDHIQYIPKEMLKNKFVRYLKAAKSFKKMWKLLHPKVEYNDEIKDKLERKYIKIRSRYDFAFWAFGFNAFRGVFI